MPTDQSDHQRYQPLEDEHVTVKKKDKECCSIEFLNLANL